MARNLVGLGKLYRPAGQHRLAESILWDQFLGSLKVLTYHLCLSKEVLPWGILSLSSQLEGSMQDVTVARLQSKRVQTPLSPLYKMYCVRVSLMKVKIFLAQHLREGVVVDLYISLGIDSWSPETFTNTAFEYNENMAGNNMDTFRTDDRKCTVLYGTAKNLWRSLRRV
jgi:hypothetical protein